jgi:hypothetical protein
LSFAPSKMLIADFAVNIQVYGLVSGMLLLEGVQLEPGSVVNDHTFL